MVQQYKQQQEQSQTEQLHEQKLQNDFHSNESEAPLDLSGGGKRTSPTKSIDNNNNQIKSSKKDNSIEVNKFKVINDNNRLTPVKVRKDSSTLHQQSAKSLTQQQQQQQQQRRIRTQMSQFQVNIMKCIFLEYKTPTMSECEALGREVGLKKRVVQVWFQNARAKEKKNPKCLKSDINYDYSNEKCLLCNYSYTSNSMQREHLFNKNHMLKLSQFIQNNTSIGYVNKRSNSQSEYDYDEDDDINDDLNDDNLSDYNDNNDDSSNNNFNN